MDEKEFKKLVDKKKYQVFVFTSPVPIPFCFAVHTWFVLCKKGKIDRWEAGRFFFIDKTDNLVRRVFRKARSKTDVFHNFYKNPVLGMNLNPFYHEPRFGNKLIGQIEGSTAEKMIKFIEKSPKIYPYKKLYKLYPGPNSNTYPQWVINHFPQSKLKLPWNAFGKAYAKRIKD